ncbi:MAG: sigma 54-dependent Fis family transcriptional regulator [Candidatus Hydrogenedentes bacterium]|nr:sigma 54-dependent Fis family transcriptional regulator [Candidatus Hydrogenedentota bacterium]
MQIVVTAKAGFTRGASWLLDAKPLVIGRSYRCDIVVDDSTVSRQHCRIEPAENGVRLLDLGSRNPALVDGMPQLDAVLKVGEEFSVGRAVFLVTAVAAAAAAAPAKRATDSDTISIDLKDLGLDAIDQESAWPGSITDYVLLFRFSRVCSHLNSEAALCGEIGAVFAKRFAPAEVLILEDDDGRWPLGALLGEAAGAAVPNEDIERAVAERRAFASSHEGKDGEGQQVLLAPVFFSQQCLGVGVLVSPARGIGNEREPALRLFSALCELVGPYVHAAREHEKLVKLNHRLSGAESLEKMPLVGQSRVMKGLRSQVYEAAQTPLNVLITGETGTGKELIARALHRNSARAEKPYIIINCAAIPPELFESELFGHEKGAFTGAHVAKRGLISVADGGILFLDEVGDLSSENQARILRVIEHGTYRRIGASHEEFADVRFIAATNRPVEDKGFRGDLYHRLAGFTIQAPPLRERTEDIPILAQYFIDNLAAREPALIRTLSPEAEQVLKQYHWAGNVRQLRNLIERVAHRARGTLITAEDIWRDGQISANSAREPGPLLSLAELEREHVLKVLRSCHDNRAKAARILGISRSTLYAKLGEYEGPVG